MISGSFPLRKSLENFRLNKGNSPLLNGSPIIYFERELFTKLLLIIKLEQFLKSNTIHKTNQKYLRYELNKILTI